MVGLLVDWLVGLMDGCLVALLVGWLEGRGYRELTTGECGYQFNSIQFKYFIIVTCHAYNNKQFKV